MQHDEVITASRVLTPNNGSNPKHTISGAGRCKYIGGSHLYVFSLALFFFSICYLLLLMCFVGHLLPDRPLNKKPRIQIIKTVGGFAGHTFEVLTSPE